MLEINNLNVCIDDYNIINNFSYNFNSGLYRLIGNNGVGKSTLLKAIAGQLIYKGDININSKKISKDDNSKYIFYIGNESTLLDNLTLKDNILIINKNIDYDILKSLELDYCSDYKLSNLSIGEYKKALIYLALTTNKPIVILDEFDNNLDKNIIATVSDLLINLSKKKTVIYVSHNVDIGGTIFNISNNKLEKSLENQVIVKNNNNIFAFYSIFKHNLLYLLVSIIFVTMLTISLSIIAFSPKKLYISYCNNNNYHIFTSNSGNINYYLESNNFHNNIQYIITSTYELPVVDINNADNPCYVFENNIDLVGTKFIYNNVEYTVSGYINSGCNDFDPALYQGIYIKSLIINKDPSFKALYVEHSNLSYYIDNDLIRYDDNLINELSRVLYYNYALIILPIIISVLFLFMLFVEYSELKHESYFYKFYYTYLNKKTYLINLCLTYIINVLILVLSTTIISNIVLGIYNKKIFNNLINIPLINFSFISLSVVVLYAIKYIYRYLFTCNKQHKKLN